MDNDVASANRTNLCCETCEHIVLQNNLYKLCSFVKLANPTIKRFCYVTYIICSSYSSSRKFVKSVTRVAIVQTTTNPINTTRGLYIQLTQHSCQHITYNAARFVYSPQSQCALAYLQLYNRWRHCRNLFCTLSLGLSNHSFTHQ